MITFGAGAFILVEFVKGQPLDEILRVNDMEDVRTPRPDIGDEKLEHCLLPNCKHFLEVAVHDFS